MPCLVNVITTYLFKHGLGHRRSSTGCQISKPNRSISLLSSRVLTSVEAWDLYDNCYRVAKEAPDDFRQLVSELGSLQGVLKNLRDDINSDKSYIKRLDADRKESLQRFLKACFVTLRKLKVLVMDFEGLGADEGIQFWKRFKWATKKKPVTELRSQIQAHTCRIQLCMSEIGNTSLARIETRIDQALERQETATEEDDVPLLDAPLSEARTNSVSRQRSNDGESASPPARRQYTGATLVDRSCRQRLVESPPSSDGSELSTLCPPTPSPRKVSASFHRRTSSTKNGPQLPLASSLADDDGGSSLECEKNSNGLLIQIDENPSSQSKVVRPGEGLKRESDIYFKSVLDSAMGELASIRQKERQSRPLRLPDRQKVPMPDEELKKQFEQSAQTEMEYRKLNTKDWLRIGTWWLLKSQFHAHLQSSCEGSSPRESMTTVRSTVAHAQAYIDLVKASWVLFDVILKSEYEIPMQADENRKLFRELSDVSVSAICSCAVPNVRRELRKPTGHSAHLPPTRKHLLIPTFETIFGNTCRQTKSPLNKTSSTWTILAGSPHTMEVQDKKTKRFFTGHLWMLR